MTRHSKILLGGVALAALGLGAAGAVARHGQHGGWGQHGFGQHGGMFGGGFGPMGRICRDGRAVEMADHMVVRIEHGVKPTEAQKAAFDELKTALRSGAEKAAAGCPAQARTEPGTEGQRPARPSPIERLANAEAMTAATLDAIKTVRPAAEKFYASLSDEQKAALTSRQRGGKHGWWRRGDRDRGPGRGPDGEGPGRGPDRDGDSTDTLP